ncbi:methylamine utilization protein [Pseudoxanthomonas sp. GM95]|uniref:methylamine utilization protein n=1 Tax=Pseudoxanthomonas sp. GM95 TaxID=1881043 RepID=UPI0020C8C2F6|nr:methylamine utilization protein [Pseudoxanthomonas sp. GM95]
MCSHAQAATVRITVNASGAGLSDAVVSLQPAQGRAAPAGTTAAMDQRDSQFVPAVLVVQTGTVVTFPNSDHIRHQVYSFSPAKRFELPLYAGTTAKPVRFDQPGVVVLGCNIHDWMLGHIVVLDTPFFATTGAQGTVTLEVPPGQYTLHAWHARLQNTAFAQQVTVTAQGLNQAITLGVAPAKPDAPVSDRVRALQEKFRRIPAESP